MRALLEKDPAKRLGSGAKGSAAVTAHPFFRTINWGLLYSRKARRRPMELRQSQAAECQWQRVHCASAIMHFLQMHMVCDPIC